MIMPAPASGATSPKSLRRTKRLQAALRLRAAGFSYGEIAAAPGPGGQPLYPNRQAAWRAVTGAMAASTRAAARDALARELCRLLDLDEDGLCRLERIQAGRIPGPVLPGPEQ